MEYQRLNSQELEEITCMIVNNVSLNNLVKITGKNKTTIYYYFRNIKGKNINPIIVDESNGELIGEFIGVFAGDGCFDKDKIGHYRIQLFFNITEQAYVHKLKEILFRLFNQYPMERTEHNKIILIYYSKNIYKLIRKYLDWNKIGRKTHSVHLKEGEYSQEFKTGFLRGSLDSDGYFSDKTIMFASSSKKLTENIMLFLNDLDIPYHYHEYVEKRLNRFNMHHVNIRKSDREKFLKLINPRECKNINRLTAPAEIRIPGRF
jgi:hypothetical protein